MTTLTQSRFQGRPPFVFKEKGHGNEVLHWQSIKRSRSRVGHA